MSAKIPGENDNEDDDDGDDTHLVSATLYARRRPLLRLDVLPFVLSYTVATTAFFGVPSLEVHALIATPALVFLHIIAFLACQWSLSARRALLMAIWKKAFPDVEKPKNGWGTDPNAAQHYIERLTGRKRRRGTAADFQIFVVTPNGHTITVYVGADTEVEDLKLLIYDRNEAPLEAMRILKGGTQLEDGKTMRFYGIQKETTLNLSIRARGC